MADVDMGKQPVRSPEQGREKPAGDRGPTPTTEAPWSNASAQDALPRDPGSGETRTLDAVGYGASVGNGMPCDACHEPPPGDAGLVPSDGRKLGTWEGRVVDLDLTAGRSSLSVFEDLGRARGYARTVGGASAVVEEEHGYRVFEVTYLWPTAAFTRDGVGVVDGRVPVDAEPGVLLFVTEDGWAIEATKCGTSPGAHIDLRHEPLSDGAPGGRLQEMVDARGEGFAEHTGDDAQILTSFEVAMRLVMLDVLASAEAEAAARPEQFESEYFEILATAEAIDATEEQLDDVEGRLLLLSDPDEWERRQGACQPSHAGEPGSPEEIEQLRGQTDTLRKQREVLRLKSPLFTRLPRAGMFLDMPREEQAEWVGETTGGVIASIGETRGFLERGELELWTLPPLIDATLRAGKFEDPLMREKIVARAAQAQWDETVCSIALAALSIGLGLAAGAATGGLAYALGGAAIATGVADTAWQTGEYFEDSALSNTAENADESFVSPEQMKGAEFWLALAWVGAGIDLAAGVKLLRMLQAGESLGPALRAIGHAGKEAGVFAETIRKNLLDELRRLVPDPEALDLELAGAPGMRIPPVDPATGVRPRNPKVDALYPEGWWDRGKGSNVHAMSSSDEFGSGGIDPELRALGEGPEVRGMHIENEPRLPEPGATRPAISELDVDLKSGEARHFRDIVGDELERDHWPSFAAVVQALEDRIGGPLDPRFKAFLYENTNTIAIEDAMHLMRRTTGGKNTPAQIAADAADLRLAFEADVEDFRRLAMARKLDPEQVEIAIEAMRQLNEELGIYTWVQ